MSSIGRGEDGLGIVVGQNKEAAVETDAFKPHLGRSWRNRFLLHIAGANL
jgi:hypothetical protein